jgi:glutaredoxin
MIKKIEIFTINHCPYCDAAKKFFKDRNLAFSEINIDGDQVKIADLIKRTGHRTMPQIFIDGTFIGGYTDLQAKFKEITGNEE